MVCDLGEIIRFKVLKDLLSESCKNWTLCKYVLSILCCSSITSVANCSWEVDWVNCMVMIVERPMTCDSRNFSHPDRIALLLAKPIGLKNNNSSNLFSTAYVQGGRQ